MLQDYKSLARCGCDLCPRPLFDPELDFYTLTAVT